MLERDPSGSVPGPVLPTLISRFQHLAGCRGHILRVASAQQLYTRRRRDGFDFPNSGNLRNGDTRLYIHFHQSDVMRIANNSYRWLGYQNCDLAMSSKVAVWLWIEEALSTPYGSLHRSHPCLLIAEAGCLREAAQHYFIPITVFVAPGIRRPRAHR